MNDTVDISLEGVSVIIGMPAHRPIPIPTVISLLNTVAACFAKGIWVDLILTAGSSVVMTARNQIAHAFLKTTATHLFWIDSDIRWSVEQFMRVLAMATQFDTARAVYPRRQERAAFDLDGLGFACIQRKVIQALADGQPSIYFGECEPCKAIFRESFVRSERATSAGADFEYYAEDSTFFADAKRLGFTDWVDPKSDLGHIGEKTYRASLDERWEVKGGGDGTADRLRTQPRQEADEAWTRAVDEAGDAGHQP